MIVDDAKTTKMFETFQWRVGLQDAGTWSALTLSPPINVLKVHHSA